MKIFAMMAFALLAACAYAADIDQLVEQADVIVQGRIIKVETGKLDEEALGHGLKKRTDIATIAIIEVLKGDFSEQRIEVQIPGLPGADEAKLTRGTNGIFILKKTDNGYAITKQEQVLSDTDLGIVRRAVKSTGGGVQAEKAGTRAERVAKAEKDLRENESIDVRKSAAFQLGDMGQTSSVPELIKALADSEADVRVAATLALSKITGRRIDMDFEKASTEERRDAIAGWNDWWKNNGERPREELLLEAIKDAQKPQPDVSRAIESLAKSANSNYVQLFRRVLRNSIDSNNDRLAGAAAGYLGHAKDELAVGMLGELLDTKKDWVSSATRLIAAGAVGEIAGKNFGTGPEAIAAAAEYAKQNEK